MQLYPALIIDALRTVRYPGTGRNVVEMGMVGDDMRIAGLHVSFSLLFSRPSDPFRRSLVKACEAAIHAHVSRDVEVEIKITSATPGQAEEQPLLPGVRNIVAVSSGKGGVGKSTVAANLAVALAQMGLRVGLLDCDISGPSVPKLFHVEDARPYSEPVDGRDLIVPIEKYGVKMLSIGFFVDPTKPTLWRGGMASNALKQMIGEAAWGALDYLVLDTPPGTSDIHLTLVQTIPLTGAIVVSTPQEVALADARKGINMYRNEKVGVPLLGLVENMAWFTPREHPAERYYIFGRGGVERLAEEVGTPLLGQIPIVQSLCELSDQGTPPALDPTDPLGHAFAQLAAHVVTETDRRNQTLEATQIVQVKR
ncbi:MAG: Mrp/NBP35 family ATP-binding protein [Prevotellaceae bacterium]|nr:Mrp/NBP35 family ATP-binding protein [Prevotellaceae bacterium]